MECRVHRINGASVDMTGFTLTETEFTALVGLISSLGTLIATSFFRKKIDEAKAKKISAEAINMEISGASQMAQVALSIVKPLRDEVTRLASRVVEAEDRIVTLERLLDEARSREDELLRAKRDLKEENEKLKQELREALEEISRLRTRVAHLENHRNGEES